MVKGKIIDIEFQYQHGAIKGITHQKDAFKVLHFNTSMVRLKEPITYYALIEETFQYQHGAIKGVYIMDYCVKVITFQYQHGAIKGHYGVIKHFLAGLFQYQHGAIKGLRRLFSGRWENFISIPAWCD